MTIRGILLDFYGTVVDEDDAVIAQIAQEIAASTPGISPADVGSLWGREFTTSCANANGDSFETQRSLAVSSLEKVLQAVNSTLSASDLCAPQFDYWQRPRLRGGSLEFLRECSLPICVVSNIDRVDLEAAISHHNISIQASVTSDDVRAYKPRPEMFVAALDLLGLNVDEVLHVGDSLTSDVAGANSLGIPVAWVNSRGKQRMPEARIEYEISSLDELLGRIADRASQTGAIDGLENRW